MKRLFVLLVSLVVALPADGHVGSKDIFEEVNAGPYRLFVTIRPPNVIPGVATIEVRCSGARVRSIRITPTPMTGEAAKHPPTSDAMSPSSADPAFFTGSLWLMASGSWQVHFDVDGAGGKAHTSVPVPAMPLSILPMQRSLGALLACLGLLLVLGTAGIVAAAVGQSRLKPGVAPEPRQRRRALIAGAFTLAFSALLVYEGFRWWNAEGRAYAAAVYRPLGMRPTLSGDTLDLKIGVRDGERRSYRSNNDLLPDHGHLMHLYAIREPGMDAAFHLHPAPIGPGELSMALPAMPGGKYRLYADIVHASGFPETLTAELEVPPDMAAAPLAGEDASATPPALSLGELGTDYKLPDGYVMVWDRPSDLRANTAYIFRFRLLDADGKPAGDMRPYLGMAGHAAFVKSDGTVFAHTHPDGSAAMQAMMLANPMDMSEAMPSEAEAIPPTVEFPYGFPSPGRYRIFIQMKHGKTVETGVFDAEV